MQWRRFGEFNYRVLDQRQPELGTVGFVPGSAGNFYTGDFDLFLTSRINDKTSVLAEVVFGEGDAQGFDIDLERALLKYDYNDHLKMSFGRYHTGIGYYNTAFHNGKWLQTTADRPSGLAPVAKPKMMRTMGTTSMSAYSHGPRLFPAFRSEVRFITPKSATLLGGPMCVLGKPSPTCM